MLRGYWGRYDTTVVVTFCSLALVFLLVLTWSLASLDAGYSENANQAAATYKDRTQERISSTCQDREPAAFTKCVQGIVESSHEAQTSEYDLSAQRSMALWAKAMFWASLFSIGTTIVGIFFVWRTLEVSQAAVETANRDIETNKWLGEVQTRAYITFENPEIGFTDDGCPVIRIKARNTGNTTGMLIIVSCSVDFEPMTPKFERIPETQIFIGSIAPQEEKPKITFATETSANGRAAATGGNFGFKFTIYGEWVNVFHKEDGAQMSYFVSAKNFGSEEREITIHPGEMQLGKRYQPPNHETE